MHWRRLPALLLSLPLPVAAKTGHVTDASVPSSLYVDAWLSPDPSDLAVQCAIPGGNDRSYYGHWLAA
jgi:hypothetical protein